MYLVLPVRSVLPALLIGMAVGGLVAVWLNRRGSEPTTAAQVNAAVPQRVDAPAETFRPSVAELDEHASDDAVDSGIVRMFDLMEAAPPGLEALAWQIYESCRQEVQEAIGGRPVLIAGPVFTEHMKAKPALLVVTDKRVLLAWLHGTFSKSPRVRIVERSMVWKAAVSTRDGYPSVLRILTNEVPTNVAITFIVPTLEARLHERLTALLSAPSAS